MTGPPPGFERLTTDTSLVDWVGLDAWAVLLRVSLLAEPAVDIPGGWAVNFSAVELRALIAGGGRKWGKDRVKNALDDLVAAGVLAHQGVKGLGRGNGSLSGRYWLTYDPGFRVPPECISLETVRDADFRQTHNGKALKGKTQNWDVYRPRLVAVPQGNFPHKSTDTDNQIPAPVISNNEITHYTGKKTSNEPTWLREALRGIGWWDHIPAPAGDPVMVTAVAQWMAKGNGGGPGWLAKVIQNGDLSRVAAKVTNADTPIGQAVSERGESAIAAMSPDEYAARSEGNPLWKQAVAAEASRQFGPAPHRLAQLRQAALILDSHGPSPLTVTRKQSGDV